MTSPPEPFEGAEDFFSEGDNAIQQLNQVRDDVTEDVELKRLADLTLLEYEHERTAAAKRLKVRAPILDRLVQAMRPATENGADLQGVSIDELLKDAPAWDDPVDPGDLLDELADTFSRHLVLPDNAPTILALWVAHTYVLVAMRYTPRLNITAPQKRCGKSELIDVLAKLVRRALSADNITASATFRVITKHTPTLLLDEYDVYLKDNEDLRGVCNSGAVRGKHILRTEGDGREVRAFQCFAAMALAGIKELPGTVHDRSIIVRMRRAKRGEIREKYDPVRHDGDLYELRRKLVRWSADNIEVLRDASPAIPPRGLQPRRGQVARPAGDSGQRGRHLADSGPGGIAGQHG